jgi:hypothetical protein
MQGVRSALRDGWARYCTVSVASLAAWRVVLGLTCVYVVLRRWALLPVMYSARGAYPVEALGDQFTWQAGPLIWVTSDVALHVVFALCLLITVAFTLGAATQIVKWLLLPVLFTVHARQIWLFTGGEAVLHLQALYAAFLPLGAGLSVDAWRRKRAGKPAEGPPATGAVQSPFYALLLAQLAVIYLLNWRSKMGPTWHDGTAVVRSLSANTLVSDFGAWIAQLPPPLLRAFTHGTLVIEAILPLFILSPWGRNWLHRLAAVLIVALHGGILLMLEVGIFSAAMMCHVPLLWPPRSGGAPTWLPSLRARRWQAAAAAALLYLAAARLGQDMLLFPERPQLPLPKLVDRVTYALGLRQPWMMFSPNPPARDFIIVTDAVTRSGRHFDPWRRLASHRSEPLKELPRSVVRSHAFTRYENALTSSAQEKLHPFFARWVLRQQLPAEGTSAADPVERFDSWLMVVSTDPNDVVAAGELEARVGVLPLPLESRLPIASFEARGVWAPERAFDGKIVPEGTPVLTPTSANMSAGCPHLTLDLGGPRAAQSAFIQADAADQFQIEGSVDGHTFHLLAPMQREMGRQHLSRVVALPGEPVRFVRIRPTISRGLRHTLSEIALFDHPITLPKLPSRPSERFLASLDRPAVIGILSGSNHPSADCSAETFKR